MGPITEAEKRENGEVEQVSLGCERVKNRSEGAGETLLSQCMWELSQEGVQVCAYSGKEIGNQDRQTTGLQESVSKQGLWDS